MTRKLVPVVIALATLLAACSSPDPMALVSSAASTTTEAGTARMFVESTVSGVGAGDLTTSGEGVVDFEGERGSLLLELPALGGAPSLATIDLVYDGTTLYYQASSLFPDAPTPWVSLDLARLGEELTGTDLSQLGQGNANDPANTLALLDGVADDVEEVGTEEVRGVETTHYRATVDIQRALEEQGAVADPERFETFLEQFGTDTIPVEVWLDDEGRAVRTRYEQPLPETPGIPTSPDARASTTIELYDFGVDAAVEIPPPSEVTDLTELLGKAAAGSKATTSTTTSTG